LQLAFPTSNSGEDRPPVLPLIYAHDDDDDNGDDDGLYVDATVSNNLLKVYDNRQRSGVVVQSPPGHECFC